MNLLLQTRLTSKEVAARCGYAEYSVFYRIFRRRIGLSPDELRRTRYHPSI